MYNSGHPFKSCVFTINYNKIQVLKKFVGLQRAKYSQRPLNNVTVRQPTVKKIKNTFISSLHNMFFHSSVLHQIDLHTDLHI